MKKRTFGRRKSDRLILWTAIGAVLGLFWTYTQGCNHRKDDSHPTISTPPTSTSVTGSSIEAPEAGDGEAAAPPANPGIEVSINTDGAVRVTNPTDTPWGVTICSFIHGPHPQTLLGDVSHPVPAGGDKTYPLEMDPAMTSELCGDIDLQIDAGQAGKLVCTNGSANLDRIAKWRIVTYDFGECGCGEPEWSDWEVIDATVVVSGCTEVDALVRSVPQCAQTITTTLTWERTDPCSQRTETRTTTEVETEPCDCEGGGSGCHISNQGGPGDTNFNLVLTKAKAHKNHTVENGFCPGDLFEECSCEAAKAAAEACGDPSAGGFFCKDER